MWNIKSLSECASYSSSSSSLFLKKGKYANVIKKILIIQISFQFKLPNSILFPVIPVICVFKIFVFFSTIHNSILFYRIVIRCRNDSLFRVSRVHRCDQCKRSARDAHKSLPVHVNIQTDITCPCAQVKVYLHIRYSFSLNRNYLKSSEQMLCKIHTWTFWHDFILSKG